MQKINLGILAASDIANHVAPTIKKIDCINLKAIASRDTEKAKAFALKQGIEKYYGSYEELINDSDIDLIYITTPHAFHAKYMEMCINSGKHIICEKAFTINAKEAERVFALAKEKNVFVTEAIWQRYTPMAKILKDFVSSGKLGKINHITANLGYNVWHRERVHENALGGGALLDVGIYTLNFADLVLKGESPASITVNAQIDAENKTDRCETVTLGYKDGVTATLYNSLINYTDRRGVIYGDKGYAVIENVNNFEALNFYSNADKGALTESIIAPPMISGYEYEFTSAAKAILCGATEPKECPHSQTLRILHLTDRIRAQMRLTYPADK